MKKYLYILLILLFITHCSSKHYTNIKIKDKIIKVEIADTEKKRTRGLMFQDSMPENKGMLFIFEKSKPLHFWMKNTKIPLSIAFIDTNFKIIKIEDMYPYDVVNIHHSEKPAKYALEMNQGWFERNNINVGDKILFLTQRNKNAK